MKLHSSGLICPGAAALTRLILVCAVGLLTAACAQTPRAGASPGEVVEQRSADQVVDADDAPPATTGLPEQDLSETILYEFLLAEIAGQRGNVGLAAQAYADLARRTRDPRIARRATEIAIFARMQNTAVEAARVWHETEPGSARALQVLAGLLVNTGRVEEALPYLRRVLGADPAKAGDTLLQINRNFASVQDKAAVLRVVRALAEDFPRLPQGRLAIAQAADAAGDSTFALAETRRAQEMRAGWEPAVLFEAQILQRGPGGPAQAVARLRVFLAAYPNAREVRLALARLLVADRKLPEARTEFQRLLADFPASTEVVYAVALLSMQMNDLPLAETQLKRLLELGYRDRDQIRFYLGQVIEEQKRLDEALQWFGEVGRGEQYLQAQLRYALIQGRQGQIDTAIQRLRGLPVENDGQRAQVVLAEASLLREAGRQKEAFDLVERALGQQPEQPDLLYDFAMLAEKLDRVDLLESSLRKLIELRPDHAHAHNALGYSLADRNQRLPEARKLIEQALKLAPEDYFIIDSMGWVLYRMGDLPGALQYLRKAYAGRPDAEIAAHLGEVLWASGARAEAERIWAEGEQKDPKNETLRNTLKRFKP